MPRTRLLAWVAVALVGAAAPARAGVVVVANATDEPVRFTVAGRDAELAPGDARPFPVGRTPELTFAKSRLQLDPYAVYVFTRTADGLALRGVEMAGPMPKPDDVPAAPPAAPKAAKLAVRLFVDEAEPRTRAGWEKVLRKRVESASAVLERQVGVSLDVAGVGEWTTDPAAEDLHARLRDFEEKAKATDGQVVIGFTSRPAKPNAKGTCPLGCTRGPLHTHLVVREGQLKTEAEEVELLVHEVAHLLGAAHSPDPGSAMRTKLGDGLARSAKFRVGLDPLNVLAVALWVNELRAGKVKGWADLPPTTRARLEVVYKTIAHALPDDPVAAECLAALEKFRPAEVEPARPAAPVAGALSAKEEAVRTVVRAVAACAADVGRLPPDAAYRPKGDRLTAEYVQAAAVAAAPLPDDVKAHAFLVGLGIALDDSTVLRNNPLTGKLCKAVESDAERAARVAALGLPTVRHRRDLCQHFAVSAALAELQGPAVAEAVGLAKEVADLAGASGFSFADLAADLAGIAFAAKVKKDLKVLAGWEKAFRVEDYVPAVTGLREGLSRKKFEADFGGVGDPRLTAALDEVRRRVAELPAYK